MDNIDQIIALIKDSEKNVEGFSAFGFVTKDINHPEANANLKGFAVGIPNELAEVLMNFINQCKPVEKIIITALAMKAKMNFDNNILNQKPNEN